MNSENPCPPSAQSLISRWSFRICENCCISSVFQLHIQSLLRSWCLNASDFFKYRTLNVKHVKNVKNVKSKVLTLSLRVLRPWEESHSGKPISEKKQTKGSIWQQLNAASHAQLSFTNTGGLPVQRSPPQKRMARAYEAPTTTFQGLLWIINMYWWRDYDGIISMDYEWLCLIINMHPKNPYDLGISTCMNPLFLQEIGG